MTPPNMTAALIDQYVDSFLAEDFVIDQYGKLEGEDLKMAHNVVKVALLAALSRREWVDSSFEALDKLKETICRKT